MKEWAHDRFSALDSLFVQHSKRLVCLISRSTGIPLQSLHLLAHLFLSFAVKGYILSLYFVFFDDILAAIWRALLFLACGLLLALLVITMSLILASLILWLKNDGNQRLDWLSASLDWACLSTAVTVLAITQTWLGEVCNASVLIWVFALAIESLFGFASRKNNRPRRRREAKITREQSLWEQVTQVAPAPTNFNAALSAAF